MTISKLKLLSGATAGVLLIGLTQNVAAHTRLNVPTMTEGTRIINHMIIGDNCAEGDRRIIGTSVVFPDGVDSTILVDGQPHSGSLTDFLSNNNGIQLFFNRAVFDFMDEKADSNGNVVGFWAGGGSGVPGNLSIATPFRLTAARIEPTSCAASVKLTISIADVCQITTAEQLGGDDDGNVKLWTHNSLGTPFDRAGEADTGPAPFTIIRNLADNPLPGSCGENGVAVEIIPSAAQINRDMPINFNGQQVWPLP
ncbi:MAG: hypothetical protein RQ714_01040 [Nitrosomonas sp.]|nr:hypothetical protein [Nitrosomonas sp.]